MRSAACLQIARRSAREARSPQAPPVAPPRQALVAPHRVAVALARALADAAQVKYCSTTRRGKKPPVGFEPTTSRLLSGCSAS